MWILLRTFDALLVFYVVDLIFRALFADIISVVEILRMETLDTFVTIKVVQGIVTLADAFDCVILSTISAVLTFKGCLVVDLIASAGFAALAVKERFKFRTKHALLQLWIVDLRMSTAQTLLFL